VPVHGGNALPQRGGLGKLTDVVKGGKLSDIFLKRIACCTAAWSWRFEEPRSGLFSVAEAAGRLEACRTVSS
jgi:hypothetical protein